MLILLTIFKGQSCTTPEGSSSSCVLIEDCATIYKDYNEKKKDPEFRDYIRNLNAICNYASKTVCCPKTAYSTAKPSPSLSSSGTRLFSIPDCGVSKTQHNRVVGGAPAAKGDKQVFLLFIAFSDTTKL